MALFAALPFLSNAQITINASDVDPLGFFAIQSRDTTPDAAILPGGSGLQTWDFTALKDQAQDTLVFYEVQQTPYDTLFPGTNLAATLDSIAYVYFEKTNNYLKTPGSFGTLKYGPYTVSTTYRYTPSQTIIQFPLELNNSYTEVVKATIQIPGLEIGLPFDSLRSVSFIERDVQVGAYGQMTTPIGTFETLRSTEVETSIDSLYIFNNGAWESQTGTNPSTITSYNWWTNQNGLGFPLVQLEVNAAGDIEATWLNSFVSSTHDSKTFLQVNISPNPTSYFLHIELPDGFNGRMEIYDLNGKRLLTSSASSGKETLDVQSLSTGSFVVILKDKKGNVAGFERFEVVR